MTIDDRPVYRWSWEHNVWHNPLMPPNLIAEVQKLARKYYEQERLQSTGGVPKKE